MNEIFVTKTAEVKEETHTVLIDGDEFVSSKPILTVDEEFVDVRSDQTCTTKKYLARRDFTVQFSVKDFSLDQLRNIYGAPDGFVEDLELKTYVNEVDLEFDYEYQGLLGKLRFPKAGIMPETISHVITKDDPIELELTATPLVINDKNKIAEFKVGDAIFNLTHQELADSVNEKPCEPEKVFGNKRYALNDDCLVIGTYNVCVNGYDIGSTTGGFEVAVNPTLPSTTGKKLTGKTTLQSITQDNLTLFGFEKEEGGVLSFDVNAAKPVVADITLVGPGPGCGVRVMNFPNAEISNAFVYNINKDRPTEVPFNFTYEKCYIEDNNSVPEIKEGPVQLKEEV